VRGVKERRHTRTHRAARAQQCSYREPTRALPRPVGPVRLRPKRTPCPMQHERTTPDWLTQPTHPYIGECGRMAACLRPALLLPAGLVEVTQPDQRGRFSAARSVYCVSRMHVRHASLAHVAPRVGRTRFVVRDSGPG